MNITEMRKAILHISNMRASSAVKNQLLRDLTTVANFHSRPQIQPRLLTKFEDAASIVGPELAAKLDMAYREVLQEKAGLVREMNGRQLIGMTSDMIAGMTIRRAR